MDQVRAILWAQWRALRNFFPRREVAGMALGSIAAILMYGLVTILAVIGARVLARRDRGTLEQILPFGLFFLFLYWQIAPLLMAVTGLSLDTKKLLAYPIQGGALFGIEVLLRISVALPLSTWNNTRCPCFTRIGSPCPRMRPLIVNDR